MQEVDDPFGRGGCWRPCPRIELNTSFAGKRDFGAIHDGAEDDCHKPNRIKS